VAGCAGDVAGCAGDVAGCAGDVAGCAGDVAGCAGDCAGSAPKVPELVVERRAARDSSGMGFLSYVIERRLVAIVCPTWSSFRALNAAHLVDTGVERLYSQALCPFTQLLIDLNDLEIIVTVRKQRLQRRLCTSAHPCQFGDQRGLICCYAHDFGEQFDPFLSYVIVGSGNSATILREGIARLQGDVNVCVLRVRQAIGVHDCLCPVDTAKATRSGKHC